MSIELLAVTALLAVSYFLGNLRGWARCEQSHKEAVTDWEAGNESGSILVVSRLIPGEVPDVPGVVGVMFGFAAPEHARNFAAAYEEIVPLSAREALQLQLKGDEPAA
jgi:hypothetical protein